MRRVAGAVIFAIAAGSCAASPRGPRAQAAAEPCALEENCGCDVPGVTLRWKAAACMAVEQTDDLEQAGVQRCLSADDPAELARLDACGRNRFWKARLCASTDPHAVGACVRDATIVPAVVSGTAAKGVGEHCPDPRSAKAALSAETGSRPAPPPGARLPR